MRICCAQTSGQKDVDHPRRHTAHRRVAHKPVNWQWRPELHHNLSSVGRWTAVEHFDVDGQGRHVNEAAVRRCRFCEGPVTAMTGPRRRDYALLRVAVPEQGHAIHRGHPQGPDGTVLAAAWISHQATLVGQNRPRVALTGLTATLPYDMPLAPSTSPHLWCQIQYVAVRLLATELAVHWQHHGSSATSDW